MRKRNGECGVHTKGPFIGRSAADKFLLSIIDAHPPTRGNQPLRLDSIRMRRLQAAKRALFAEKTQSGRVGVDDYRALWMMAVNHALDLVRAEKNPDENPRSTRRLAQEVTRRTYGNSSHAIIDRLRRRFEKEKTYWLFLARDHDFVVETIEWLQLRQLQPLLLDLGIRMRLSEFEESTRVVAQDRFPLSDDAEHVDRLRIEKAISTRTKEFKFKDPDAADSMFEAALSYRDRISMRSRKHLMTLVATIEELRELLRTGDAWTCAGLITASQLQRLEERARERLHMRDILQDHAYDLPDRKMWPRALRAFIEQIMVLWHENGGEGKGSSYRPRYTSKRKRSDRPGRHEGPLLRLLIELLRQAKVPVRRHSPASLHNAITAVYRRRNA